MHGRIQLRDRTRQSEHERERVLGHAGCAASGSVHHQDAAASRGLQIDIVHAHACAAHDAQLWSARQQFLGHPCCAAHDQCVGVGELGGQRRRGWLRNLPARIHEQLHSVRTDFIGNNNFHGTRA